MPKPPKLKVFCAPMGFYDALVAAPSQKAALKAWGTSTDLFAAGRASIVEDPELQELALATPGEVVKRSRGDEAEILQDIAKQDGPVVRATPKAGRPTPRASVPPPDRSKLDEAERALQDARRELETRLADLERRRAKLQAEERTARLDGEARIVELERERDKEQRAYDRAAARSR